jgi:hypothetical protein
MPLDLRSIFKNFVEALTLSLSVHQLVGPIRAKDNLVGEAVQQLADAVDDIQRTLQKLDISYVPRIDVTATDGGIVAWLGSKDDKRGAAFNELYAGPTAVEDPDNAEFKVDASGVVIQGTTLVIKQLLIADLSWTDDSPGGGSIAWSACTVRFNGTDYSITGDNTALKFVYWDVGDSTFSESNSPTPQQDRFLIATNDGGTTDEAWNKVANRGIQGAHVLQEAIATEHLNATEIKVGGGGGKPGKFGVYNGSDVEIGFIGTDGSVEGGWLKELGIGGADKDNPVFFADSSGNVTIDGAVITLTSSGETATVGNPGDGYNSGFIVEVDAVGYQARLVSQGLFALGTDGFSNPTLGYLISQVSPPSDEWGIFGLGEQDGTIRASLTGHGELILNPSGDAAGEAIRLVNDATIDFDWLSGGSGLAGAAGASAGYLIVKHRGTTYKLEVFADA